MPSETVNALLLEYQVYRATQLYRCPRSQAVNELQLEHLLPPFDGWAVKLHFEFSALEAKAKNA